ncbi:MAG: YceI family protein [Planctomycetes bacterium]|nr:YceI family protein [Planctomycetota bacterium]
MKLKLLLLAPVFALPLAFRSPTPAAAPLRASASAAGWKIDPVHSTVLFKIKHVGTSYTLGRFNGISGALEYDPASFGSSKITVEIDPSTVDTNCKPREDHLRSPDFFSVKEFPKISFASTKVEGSADKFTLTGDLTLHGVTKSIHFSAEKVGESDIKEMGGPRVGFFAQTTIKRSDFGMKNMLEGASDEVGLTLALELTH